LKYSTFKIEELLTDANLNNEIVAPDTPNNLLEALNSPGRKRILDY
jgi:hypothetical protein